MEIKRYLEEYKKHSVKDFYEWASQGKTMELRFLKDRAGNKFNNWELLETLSKEFNIEKRFSSLYINSYEELIQVFTYKLGNYPLVRLYNIYISVNPKRKVLMKSQNGLLYKSYYGGLVGCECIQNILCDIEFKEQHGPATEAMIEECIDAAKFLVNTLDLHDYYINISGNGAHLWFRLEKEIHLPIPSHEETDTAIIYNKKEPDFFKWVKKYNNFIEYLDELLQGYNDKIKVDDGAKDISRVARCPGSWNVKVNRTNRCVGTVVKENLFNKGINHKFTSVKSILNKSNENYVKNKRKTRKYRYNHLTIRDAPLVKLMLKNKLSSKLSRNHYLEQSLAKLLRDNEIDISDIRQLIQEIDIVQQKSIQVDPSYLDDEDEFNPETINVYCIECGYDLVYPILDEIPEIPNKIPDEKFDMWNAISLETLRMMVQSEIPEHTGYLTIKKYIRESIDRDISTEIIFFTCKIILKEEWEYYYRNKIVQTLINKTRKRS